jgi:hypothetical protein
VFVGLESGSATVQAAINKRWEIRRSLSLLKECRQLGIEVTCSFMVGFPGEKQCDTAKTVEAAVRARGAAGSSIQLHSVAVMPGTGLYRDQKDNLSYTGSYSDQVASSARHLTDDMIHAVKNAPAVHSAFHRLRNNTVANGFVDCVTVMLGAAINVYGRCLYMALREGVLSANELICRFYRASGDGQCIARGSMGAQVC